MQSDFFVKFFFVDKLISLNETGDFVRIFLTATFIAAARQYDRRFELK